MLSIIIHVFNEANGIIKLLEHLSQCLSGENEVEIFLVDGGSSDGTKGIMEN